MIKQFSNPRARWNSSIGVSANGESPYTDELFKLYARDVNAAGARLLTRDEELHILKKVRRGNPEAFEKALLCNVRLVWSIAEDYHNSGLPFLDLVEEGTIGLMKAVRKFRENKGAKLSTYAAWWIHQAIRRALAKQVGNLRLPVGVAAVITRLRRVSWDLEQRLERRPTDEEIADEIGKPVSFVNAHLSLVRRTFISLNALMDGDDPSGDTWVKMIADPQAEDPSSVLEDTFLEERLEKALACLTALEKDVIVRRSGFCDGRIWTLDNLGKKYKVSRERIRQVEAKALRKLRHPSRRKILEEIRHISRGCQ